MILIVIVIVVVFVIAIIAVGNNPEKKEQREEEAKEFYYNKYHQMYLDTQNVWKSEYNAFFDNPENEWSDNGSDTEGCHIEIHYKGKSVKRPYYIWRNRTNLCLMSLYGDSIEQFIEHECRSQTSILSLYRDQESKEEQDRGVRKWLNEIKFMGVSIPLDKIEYFSIKDDKYITTSITGGGGTVGGSSITGALVGGVVGGAAGAVIGSRKESKIEPISVQNIKHDDSIAIIKYINENGQPDEVVCDVNAHKFYETLKKVIPEKEYEYMISKSQLQSNETIDIEAKLKKLKTLLDNGLITQEEFDEKRKKLINSI